MEKQRIKSISKSCKRLLIGFVVFAGCSKANILNAQQITAAQIAKLRIQPSENQNLYTKTDIKFEVLIPNTNPSNVILQNTNINSDYTLKTIRKTQEYGEIPGTRLELWYNFDKKGTYKISPLSLYINNRRRTIAFLPVTIANNPEFLSPRIVILFDDETAVYSDEIPADSKKPLFTWKTGEKISFKVCLQYAVQLVQFSWELPKESIFTQTKTYEITEIKYREKRYSEDLIPVAEFEWTALSDEIKKFPKIKLTATGYNGYKSDLLLPEIPVMFVKQEINQIEEESDFDIFDLAFENISPKTKKKELKNKGISDFECFHLADLRIKERYEILYHNSNRQNRIAYEEEMGISAAKNEFYMGLLYFSIILLIISFLSLIISLRKKNFLAAILSSGMMIFFSVFFIFMVIQANKKFAISKGCTITSIPEANAKSNYTIGAGNRVQILERSGNWVYIQLGESGGWCTIDDIIEL